MNVSEKEEVEKGTKLGEELTLGDTVGSGEVGTFVKGKDGTIDGLRLGFMVG